MSEVHTWPANLNWLLALDALLSTRSVSAAARQVNLTQPAMSRVLGKLRAHFGDGLLVRAGRVMVPTPRALELQGPLRTALESVKQAISGPEPFSPERSRRTWRLATADYVTAALLPALSRRLEREGPRMKVVTVPVTSSTAAELADGTVDAALCPQRPLGAGVIWSRLLRDDWVAQVRRQHPVIGDRLTLPLLCSTAHIFVAPSGQATGALDDALAKLGRSREIALRLQSFVGAPLVAASSDLLAVVPRRVAEALGPQLGLRTLELPLYLPELSLASGWHERNRHDEGHRWFRRLLVSLRAEG